MGTGRRAGFPSQKRSTTSTAAENRKEKQTVVLNNLHGKLK